MASVVVVAILAGVAATLGAERLYFDRPQAPDRTGLPIVCTSFDRKCWQAGQRVDAPHVGDACSDFENANFEWNRITQEGGPLFNTWACTGAE